MTLFSSLFLFLNPTAELIGWIVSIMGALIALSTAYLRIYISNELRGFKEAILSEVEKAHPSHAELEVRTLKLQSQIDNHGRELMLHDARLGKLEGNRTGH